MPLDDKRASASRAVSSCRTNVNATSHTDDVVRLRWKIIIEMIWGCYSQVSLGCLEISFNYITCIAVSIPVPPKEVLLFPLRFKGFRTWQASLLPWMRMVQWLGWPTGLYMMPSISPYRSSPREMCTHNSANMPGIGVVLPFDGKTLARHFIVARFVIDGTCQERSLESDVGGKSKIWADNG